MGTDPRDMTLNDSYLELELYLEKTKDEINELLELKLTTEKLPVVINENKQNSIGNRKEIERKTDNISTSFKESELKLNDTELDPFLMKFNNTIEYELTQLLTNYESKNNKEKCGEELEKIDDLLYKCDLENIFNDWDSNHCNLEKETDILSDIASNASFENSVTSIPYDNPLNNVGTQTSPSLSPSSTNLTWASECSSSPCLTSSDSDLIDEECHSSSSIDATSLQSPWVCRYQQVVLNGKSSSAPVLKKLTTKVNKQPRSQSDRHLAEIEAAEACKWLRATGFPQYAQMYEDMQFPIDINTVEQDHPLLEPDVLKSLFRRLQILNNCVHLHQQRNAHHTDESEDENCALSNNWTYQTDIRRWSRACNSISAAQEESLLIKHTSQETDDVFEEHTESPKDKLRRAGSVKFRRRRGDIISDSDNRAKLLDSISQQLNSIDTKLNHLSDSECTPTFRNRLWDKSLEKNESWPYTKCAEERMAWTNTKSLYSSSDDSSICSSNGVSIWNFSSTQLQVLRKLALLKLTAHMENHCPTLKTGWNWELPKFIRKIKAPAHKDKAIFGVPISVILQRTGHSLPKNIEEALIWLEQNAYDQVGLFRKSGVKSRIQILRNLVESHREILNFNDQQAYDVADMVKLYFRELPEALLTTKLSETFILIFQHVNDAKDRREAVLCAILLMPEDHVEVLQSLMRFLLSIAKHSAVNQMNESNLATCFAPSLFHYSQAGYKQNLGSPHPKELAENRAAHECLVYFLEHYDTVFMVPKEFINQCNSSEMKETKAKLLSELGEEMGGWKEFLDKSQRRLQKEVREKSRGWISIIGHNSRVEISFKKVEDGFPLRLWKVCADIDAPPSEVLHRILRERHIWDSELVSAKIVVQLDKKTEVFQYSRKKISPLPNEEYCVVRTWKSDLPKDSCLIVETSVEHPDASPIPNTVRGIILASRYLIEPCGSGRSRVLHLARADTMGRSPEWYHKNYGHIIAFFMANLQNSFYQKALGPESKV